MNTFEVKQAAVRNVEAVLGMPMDASNKQHALLMGMFVTGAQYVAANPGLISKHLKEQRPTQELLTAVVEDKYGITLQQMKTKARNVEIRLPRQVLSTLLCEIGGLTTVRVGKLFYQDHSTVVNSIRVVNDYVATDRHFKHEYMELLATIQKRMSDEQAM